MFDRIREDIRNVFDNDPAAKSTIEVILCYPGLHALGLHRLAHWFWVRNHQLIGRFISHVNRFITGIEIHPGATIGRRFFIDHGMGVVIGETSVIGDDVLLYKGVLLGGTSLENKKRHPTIGNNVVIGTNALILGDIEIGDNCTIGAGSVVTKSAEPGSTIVGIPGRALEAIKADKNKKHDLEHGEILNPLARTLNSFIVKQECLEKVIYDEYPEYKKLLKDELCKEDREALKKLYERVGSEEQKLKNEEKKG